MSRISIPPKKVIIVHEFNGRKYFEALSDLQIDGEIETICFVESSVIKQLFRNIFRDKKPFLFSLNRSFVNLLFRLKAPFLKDKVIILGIPPWDFRMVWYGMLARNNKLIYHTSWSDWQINKVPRRYGPLNHILRWCWFYVLQLPNIQIVAVIPETEKHLKEYLPNVKIRHISHAFSHSFDNLEPVKFENLFGILFVGELTEKKGIHLLIELFQKLDEKMCFFGVVGDGDSRKMVDNAAKNKNNVTNYGKIGDREKLAEIYAKHHVLIVPSQKTSRWEELFGMVIIEAMAAGLPIIASNHIGPRSIITHNKDGFLVEENSISDFTLYIISLLQDSVKWKAMSENAKAKSKNYSMKNVSKKWLDLLGSVQNS